MLRHPFAQHLILGPDLLFQILDALLLGLQIGAGLILEGSSSVFEELLLPPVEDRWLKAQFVTELQSLNALDASEFVVYSRPFQGVRLISGDLAIQYLMLSLLSWQSRAYFQRRAHSLSNKAASWSARMSLGMQSKVVRWRYPGTGIRPSLAGRADNGNTGAAWVYTRSGGVWTQQGKLVGTGAVGNAAQGVSVALSGDGNSTMGGPPHTRHLISELSLFGISESHSAEAGIYIVRARTLRASTSAATTLATFDSPTQILHRKMPLQVPAIVEYADHVDYALTFAAAVDDEVPGITYNSKLRPGASTAEAQVIDPDALGEIRLL